MPHNLLAGNLPKTRMFALASTLCNMFSLSGGKEGKGGGGIGIFINTVLEEASQISDYRPPSSRLSNFDMKYNTFATPGKGGGGGCK